MSILHLGLQGVLLKVYELNSRKLYTSTQAEADLNLELAGVAPTHTLTLHTLPDPLVRWGAASEWPLERCRVCCS